MKTIKGFEGEELEVSEFGEWVGNDYIDYKFEYENNQKAIKELSKEYQKLVKQLEDLFSENGKLRKKLENCMTFQDYEHILNEKKQLKKQQKEFIDWLENKIKFWKDKIFENAITENDWTLAIWRNKLRIFEDILSKFKEKIGDDNK